MHTATGAGPADRVLPAPSSRRGLKVVLAALVLLLAGGAVGAGGLLAWDAGYEGRILPGVSVGEVSLAGLDRAQAEAAISAAYPYQAGRLVLRTPDGEVAIDYQDVGRRPDAGALVDRALAVGRDGGPLERAVGQLRLMLDGSVLAPEVALDAERLTRQIRAGLEPLERAPVDATIRMEGAAIVIGRSAMGRHVDADPIIDAAISTLRMTDAPAELVITVPTTVVRAAVGDDVVLAAQAAANRIAQDLEITFRDRSWTIRAGRIRSWLTFEQMPDGGIEPMIDAAKVPEAFGRSIARTVARKPASAQFLVARSGRTVGVIAGRNGRRFDPEATTAAVVASLMERAAGRTIPPVKIRTAVVPPELGTEEAARKAPVMSLLGSWKTWFPISERNYNGANIWVPAKLINGTVLRPGQTFDWWDAIWPVTPARGFGPGGIIRVDHTEPTGALGGGMCSSSTTLFNAAMRAGLDIGARYNHRYYIDRYPLGLDATVSIIRGSRQSMTFRNDMATPIFIRGIRTRNGSVGWVRYEIWGIPDGRTTTVSRPSVTNVQRATTKEVLVDTLPRGRREQIEYPSDGRQVTVTRVVRNANGRVLHRNTWVSRYVRWDGLVHVGR